MTSSEEIQFAEINTDGKTPRSRKLHQKTRTGCNNCKLRKIKCDEQLPKCRACTKRDLECTRATHHASRAEEGLDMRPTDPHQIQLNLAAVRLFYHFEHVASETLALGAALWKRLIPLALEHEYLLHAMLTIAAAHIRSLDPSDQTYVEVELQHQSAALNGLRSALRRDINSLNPDVLFSAAVLVYHYAWTTGNGGNPSFAVDIWSGFDDLVPLGSGIKGMVMEKVLARAASWAEIIAYSPRMALTLCTLTTKLPEEFEEAFSKQYSMVCNEDPDQWRYDTFMTECRRLIPVMSVLKFRDRGLGSIDTLLASITRYFFTWPVLLSDGFFQMEKQKDCLAHLVLVHYFMAIAKSGIELWWASQRTRLVLERLSRHLNESGVQVLDMFASPQAPGNA